MITFIAAPPAAKTQARILSGDNRQVLETLEENSVQCCVTSPPYWGLRDYGNAGQLGAEASPLQYVENLVGIFRKVARVLKPDGVLWLNIGDGYARNGGTASRHGPNARVGNTRRQIQKRNCRVPDCWGLQDQSLLGLPWRTLFALQEDGWILRSHVTWVKKCAMPESVRTRPTRSTEALFMLVRSLDYYYDHAAVRGQTGANLRDCWMLGPDNGGKGHPASFPRELVRRCLLLTSRPGDTVLDPFGGSGTTGLVARDHGRNSVLIELNDAYAKSARKRISYGE